MRVTFLRLFLDFGLFSQSFKRKLADEFMQIVPFCTASSN